MACDAAIVSAGLRPRILADRNGRVSMHSGLDAQRRETGGAAVDGAEFRPRFKASKSAWIAAPKIATRLA
jgi:hypothetical protein